ncbi:YuiA family protein [Paenactinomyces guangxiensis]|nr:YuiA family protein [Paenactinomyces guangxiensis]
MSRYHKQLKCSYCNGDGYVQLLLGGSETCHACKGTGKKEMEEDQK